ncbi:tRNA methyltransferase 10 homolog A-like [Oscarella lobularis]|uniref:tRNA methyltransferase 10 homolog A-like n=1 Tax=Oscarella lobularis TaxID=121494 RepID=UPI0033143F68
MDEDTGSVPTEPVSKSERKRLRKRERWMEAKKRRKATRKEKRKASNARRIAEGRPSYRIERRMIKEKESSIPSPSDMQTVVIDLSFDDLMEDRNIKKLVNQIQRSYACNRRAVRPMNLHLTDFGGKTEAKMIESAPGYTSWNVHIHKESYLDIFEKENLVYLTSESDQVMTELDLRKVYIIGGLVDHNHHKGLCYKKAMEAGIGHAQLPIAEYIRLASRSVLTVNHVFEILSAFEESKDWREAFRRVIPERKVAKGKEQSKDTPSIVDTDKEKEET